ncbi:hypothetical protein KS4_27940 [Poriferisphaera corsica]|uniref:Uncharacterized protein n=1 Tax=Poriferisphaera corsica TaxID=2528020 RepID=A0A517YWY0_9BACT|nr:hypothetical protein [Poriferisphaera corsica]QDU34720.1 hypothetical protein KS4_27940 [Poriferisphaera corsica]
MFTNNFTKSTAAAVFSAGMLIAPNVFASEDLSLVDDALMESIVEVTDRDLNLSRISIFGGVDVVTAYYSRGLKEEDRGVIIQPWGGISFNLFDKPETDDLIKSLDVYGAWWGSIHSNETGSTQTPDSFYESDYSIGLTAGLQAGFTLNAEYAINTSPSGSWDDSHDVNLKVSYDDAEFWEAAGVEFPGFAGFQPYFKTCIRVKATSNETGYFWIGVNPTFDLLQSESLPITFSTPMTIGFGDGGYYDSTDGGSDFGYADAGITASMPLEFIPKEYGDWAGYVGFKVIYIGEDARVDRTWEPVASFGLSFSY